MTFDGRFHPLFIFLLWKIYNRKGYFIFYDKFQEEEIAGLVMTLKQPVAIDKNFYCANVKFNNVWISIS
jgi:hypothetical protein